MGWKGRSEYLAVSFLALSAQVGLAVLLGLVESVDDLVDALLNADLAHLALAVEADLADLHTGRLLQVGPGRVDDVDVVHLVALRPPVRENANTRISATSLNLKHIFLDESMETSSFIKLRQTQKQHGSHKG